MARAKRTDRTEARRRYRAELAALGGEPTTDDVVEAAPTKARSTSSKASAPAQRPSITASFKAAYHPVDLRADLRAAPQVLTHWGVLVACGIAIVSAAVFIVSTNDLAASIDFTASSPTAGKTFSSASNISALIITMFLQPPPIAGAFLIGFTAKRASWMGGLLLGIVAAVCWAILLSNPAGQLLTGGQPGREGIISAAILSPMGAALFASAAAWYRRFLDLSNPNRGQPRGKQGTKQGSSGKKAAGSSARR